MSSSPIIQTAKVKFPLGSTKKPKELANFTLAQIVTVQSAADYANQPAVQTAAVNAAAAANAVDVTVGRLANLEVEVKTLMTQRDQQVVTLTLAHGTLRSALNDACKGNKAAAQAWTGQLAERSAAIESTAPPTNAMVKTTRTAGTIEVKCQAERGVVCYLIQQGIDPASPDAWPPPAISSGSKHKVAGLTIGQKAHFRIAIVRRNGGQGAWSDVMAVIVR